MTLVNGASMTRRTMLLSLPTLALTTRCIAQRQVAPLSVIGLRGVTLAVSDVERSVAFYQDLFGLSVQRRNDQSTLLPLNDGSLWKFGGHFLTITEAGSAGPRIDHFSMAVDSLGTAHDVVESPNPFPNRVVEVLADHGITEGETSEGLSGGRLRVRVENREAAEIYLSDLNGLIIRLLHPEYCGGFGPLGTTCPVINRSTIDRPGGSLSIIGLSHLTINVPDPQSTNVFYQETFGMDVQALQAASPLLGVGRGSDFLMFISLGRTGRANTAPVRINHACLTVEDFDVQRIQSALEEHGIRPREMRTGGSGSLRHWVSMRMPNRGGAREGTPELYFSDPDGLSIQLQDVRYCGGGGYLGESC